MHFQKEVVKQKSFGRLPSSTKKVVIQRPREMVVKMDDHSVLKNGLLGNDRIKTKTIIRIYIIDMYYVYVSSSMYLFSSRLKIGSDVPAECGGGRISSDCQT